MVDILHRVGITATPEAVYTALTTADRVAEWWTEDAAGDGEAGGVIRFGFEPGEAVAADAAFVMKVLETKPGELVLWEVAEGPREWLGTHIRFELTQQDGMTIVLFSHAGWPEAVEFMHHCSTKWAIFLMSLKELLETGTGHPAPRDVQISNWH